MTVQFAGFRTCRQVVRAP